MDLKIYQRNNGLFLELYFILSSLVSQNKQVFAVYSDF